MRNPYCKIFLFVMSFSFVLLGCRTTSPEIIPAKGVDNVVIARIRDDILQPGVSKVEHGWLWWYVPAAIITILWAIKTLFISDKESVLKK